jgi:hypothetical protein
MGGLCGELRFDDSLPALTALVRMPDNLVRRRSHRSVARDDLAEMQMPADARCQETAAHGLERHIVLEYFQLCEGRVWIYRHNPPFGNRDNFSLREGLPRVNRKGDARHERHGLIGSFDGNTTRHETLLTSSAQALKEDQAGRFDLGGCRLLATVSMREQRISV